MPGISKVISKHLETNQIYCGDARALLQRIEVDTIACSVWSPPYFVGKEYEKHLEYSDWVSLLRDVIGLHTAILRPGAFLVINIADILCFKDKKMPRLQASNVLRQNHKITRQAVLTAKLENPTFNKYQLAELLGCSEQTIDRRLNGNNIRGGKYQSQTRVHLVGGMLEQASLEAGLYLYDRRVWVKDAAWQNSKWHTLSYRSVDEFEYLYFFWKPGVTIVDRHRLTPKEWVDWGSRGVWSFPSVRANDDHEAKFPVELPRRVIRLLTDPGDIILDCFMGSGSTAEAAIIEDRDYIGIELNAQYVDSARQRCERIQNKLPSI